MAEEGISFAALSKKLVIGKNQLKYWKGKGEYPKDPEILRKLTNYFSCSDAYLLGYTNDRTPPAPPGKEKEPPTRLGAGGGVATLDGAQQALLQLGILEDGQELTEKEHQLLLAWLDVFKQQLRKTEEK